jgi:hypothetical protein
MGDIWIQSVPQHQTITKMLSDALFVELDPNGTAIAKLKRGKAEPVAEVVSCFRIVLLLRPQEQ